MHSKSVANVLKALTLLITITPTLSAPAPEINPCQWTDGYTLLPCTDFAILLTNSHPWGTPYVNISSASYPDGELHYLTNCEGDKNDFPPSGRNEIVSSLPKKLTVYTGPKWCESGGNADHLTVQYGAEDLNVPDLKGSGCLNPGPYVFRCVLGIDGL